LTALNLDTIRYDSAGSSARWRVMA
jgi:hypothetical protein